MSDNISEYQSAQICSPGKSSELKEEDHALQHDLFNIKKEVEHLRKSAQLQRAPLSSSINEMVQFINNNIKKDHLVSGFKSHSDNPFEANKWKCRIL